MSEQTNRDCAKNLLYWIKKYSWEENDARTDAELKFEINPFNGDGSVDECARESLQALTFDDINGLLIHLLANAQMCFRLTL